MKKIIKILSNTGKVITIYFIMFITSLMLISFSSSFNPKYHQRCVTDMNKLDFTFLNKYQEVEKYQLFLSCNNIDVVIDSNLDSKKEAIALVIDFSYEMKLYNDLQIVINLENDTAFYFKIKNVGEVLVV